MRTRADATAREEAAQGQEESKVESIIAKHGARHCVGNDIDLAMHNLIDQDLRAKYTV